MPNAIPLVPVRHDLSGILWCGLAVLSAITGAKTSRCRREVAQVRGCEPRQVRGISVTAMGRALEAMRTRRGAFRIAQVRRFPLKPITLARLVAEMDPADRRLTWVLHVTGHWVVISQGKFLDNRTTRPVPLKDAPGRRKLVKRAILIERAQESSNV